MSELHDLLDRATDRVETPDGRGPAAAALARAGVVRRRRRVVAASVATAAVVVGVAVVTGVSGSDRTEPPVAPPSVPQVSAAVVEPAFDPEQATSLPELPDSGLPTRLVPPAQMSSLPMAGPAAIVLYGDLSSGELFLVDDNGGWARTVSPSGNSYTTSLSPDGTTLASLGQQALWVTDVRDGAWREVPLPESWLLGSLGTQVQWLGPQQVVLDTPAGPAYSVWVDGAQDPGEHDRHVFGPTAYTTAPDGAEIAFGINNRGEDVVVESRAGTRLRELGAAALGNIGLPVANRELVAAMSSQIPVESLGWQGGGIIVLDRDDYAAVHYLPIAGTDRLSAGTDGLSMGGVTPIGWLDDGTALLRVYADVSLDWSLVAWDVQSGELSRVAVGTGKARLSP